MILVVLSGLFFRILDGMGEVTHGPATFVTGLRIHKLFQTIPHHGLVIDDREFHG